MSRLHLTPDQIEVLDWETLNDLRDQVNDEQALLADVERSIYKRRRKLELEKYQELAEEQESKWSLPPTQAYRQKKPLTPEDIAAMIREAGLPGTILKQFIK